MGSDTKVICITPNAVLTTNMRCVSKHTLQVTALGLKIALCCIHTGLLMIACAHSLRKLSMEKGFHVMVRRQWSKIGLSD